MTIAAIIFHAAWSVGLPVLLVAWLLRQRGGYTASPDLTRAGNVIAKGVVEADAAPVTIDYEQGRTSLSRTSVGRKDIKAAYQWDETKRTIKGTPFVLRTADQRIQVDPDEDDVSLLWDPDHAVTRKHESEWSRVRRAILEPGATVEIFGRFIPAPSGGDPYREGSQLPMLVASRVERLLISRHPIAPKFVAMRRYLMLRAGATLALAAVVHVAVEPLWDSDVAQLGVVAPSDTVRAWIGIGFAVIAYYLMRMKRPWSHGKCTQIELIKK